MPSLSFRYATATDADALASLAAKAFSDTYRDLDDPQEIADYVAKHFNAPAVRGLILDPRAKTLLASTSGSLAGYAVLAHTPRPSCVTGAVPIELVRFYLAERYIGRGFGVQLMSEVHREAKREGARTIWLGVHDRNIRAINFYERMGFVKAGGTEFQFGGRTYIDPVYATPVRDDA